MDYFCEVFTLGIDSIIFGICFHLYIKNKNAVQAIKVAPVIDINSKLNDIVKFPPDNKIPYVVIRGTVGAIGSPIKSINSPTISGVVQRLSIKQHLIARGSTGFWAAQERTIQEIYNIIPFYLKSGKVKIEVLDVLSSDILDLETIADNFEPNIPSLADHLWDFLTGVKQRGIQSTEEILREGAIITGIGELMKSDTDKSLKLQPPTDGTPFYLTILPIRSLLRKLEQHKKTYGFLTLMCASIGLVLGYMIGRKWWKEHLRRRHEEELRKQIEETRRERRKNARDTNIELSESQLCVVCKNNPKEIILLPCGHVCICGDCNDDITHKCPICRTEISNRAVAYIA